MLTFKQYLNEKTLSGGFKKALASTIIGAGLGAGAGVATPYLSNFKAEVGDKIGAVVGVEGAGNAERAKQNVRSQVGLGANTPPTTRGGIGAALGGALGLYQLWKKRQGIVDE